ncbi:MAG TPA: hypothetical protein VHP30_03080 [Ignavibacteriales bacterium]|nr:hypothetical protein [Ignavibacteriales bacterium]
MLIAKNAAMYKSILNKINFPKDILRSLLLDVIISIMPIISPEITVRTMIGTAKEPLPKFKNARKGEGLFIIYWNAEK